MNEHLRHFNWTGMNKLLVYSLALLLAGCGGDKKTSDWPDVNPPKAETKPTGIVAKHGHKRIDPYYWMKDRQDSAVVQYLRAENAYTDTMMAHLQGLRTKLLGEMQARIVPRDTSAAVPDHDYLYYTRYTEGGDYPLYCRRKTLPGSPEEIIANGNELARGSSYFQMHISMSHDHQRVAISTDSLGRRFYTVRFRDLTTGQWLRDRIDSASGTVQWGAGNNEVVYLRKDPVTLRAKEVYRHVLGNKTDPLLYAEKDQTLELDLTGSRSHQFIFISSSRTDGSAVHYLDAANLTAPPIVVEPFQAGVKYEVNHYQNRFLIRTNLNAPNFRIVEAPIAMPGKGNWKDVVPNREKVFLHGFELFKTHLVLEEEQEGLGMIRLMKWTDKSEYLVEFAESSYAAWLVENPDPDATSVRYHYQSMTAPPGVFTCHLMTHEKELVRQQQVPGYEPTNYQSERLFIQARDGASVPVSIVYRKDKFKRDGTNPCLQYGYGSYGYSEYPEFDADLISLLDRGFVFAVAHIRGGQEMGAAWYAQGRMLHKKNTFTDFIDATEYLRNNKYASRDLIFAHGRSAGGLLMGAITNMRPDLYKGIIAGVPFVDVVTTMMDESVPLTTQEWKEWGNPNIQEEYEYMLSYSPYDQVQKKDYPHLLVMTAFHDSQVQYWEPAKWVAKLRAMKTDHHVLLLYTDMKTGHGGAPGRLHRHEDEALRQAFMLGLSGITE